MGKVNFARIYKYAFADKCVNVGNIPIKYLSHLQYNAFFLSLSQLTMSNIIHGVQVLLIVFIIEVLSPASGYLQWEVRVVQLL
jgi:hypothetical protein